MTYLVSTWLFTGINISLVSAVPLHARIGLGYALFFLSLIAIPILDLLVHSCIVSINLAYYITIITVAVVGIGSGVQQSSYYGLSGMLPQRYPQAVMAGESVATTVVSFTRILTKASTTNERFGAIAFFLISILFILCCVGCQQMIRLSPFVRYHVQQCRSKTSEEDDEEEEKEENLRSGLERDDQQLLTANIKKSSYFTKFKVGLLLRWMVMREIWKLLVAAFVTYFCSLLLFPGLVSLIQHCSIGDWTPILLVAVFNVPDLIAKWVALLPLRWSSSALMTGSFLRLLLIPPILLLVSPSPTHPIISSGTLVWAVILVAILGFSNGYFGSLPMIVFSAKVKDPQNLELAGTIVTLFILTGLMIGSVLAYSLTPLTEIAPISLCSNSTQFFHSCSLNSTIHD